MVDTELTWDNGLSAEQKTMAKTHSLSQIGIAEFTFTTTTRLFNMGGEIKSESVKVVYNTDACITCESTDEHGAVTRNVDKVSHNVMNIINVADPAQIVALKRK